MPTAVPHIVTWANGETLMIPITYSSWNGWWYRPKEARINKKKTFGQTSVGQRAAREWFIHFVKMQFGRRNWEIPTSVSPKSTPKPYGHAIELEWTHPLWGTTHVGVDGERYSSCVTVTANPIAFLYAGIDPGQVITAKGVVDLGTASVQLREKNETYTSALQRWAKDPLRATIDVLGDKIARLFELVEFPHLQEVTPEEAGTFQQDGVKVTSNGTAHLYFERANKLAIIAGIDGILNFVDAMPFHHVTAKILTTYLTGQGAVPTGIEFVIPAMEGEKGRDHDHLFQITMSGVTVKCGYVEDENRWVDHQKRHAADVLKSMMSIETTKEHSEYKL